MLTYTAARELLVGYLIADATAHEKGRFDEIGRRFDSFEHQFPAGDEPGLAELRLALTFWDAWIDARNHGWQTTAGIQPAEWPVLSRAIATDLAAERPVSDPRVRTLFDVIAHSGLSDRVQVLASRLRERDQA